MANKVVKKVVKKVEKEKPEEVEVEVEVGVEVTPEPPKEHADLVELRAIHAGLTKFGIRDIGQLEVRLAQIQ